MTSRTTQNNHSCPTFGRPLLHDCTRTSGAWLYSPSGAPQFSVGFDVHPIFADEAAVLAWIEHEG